MTAYPYVMSPEKVPLLFKKIGDIGIPGKFSNVTLKSSGFTSSNDYRFIGLLRFLQFIDGQGVPLPAWKAYRTKPKEAMGQAVRTAYADLFQHYSDAHQRDDEALRTYFAANTTTGAETVSKMVSTFKAICKLGDLSGVVDEQTEVEDEVDEVIEHKDPHTKIRARTNAGGSGMTVNINIQLQLPADATPETYERFFEAMRKHVLNPAE